MSAVKALTKRQWLRLAAGVTVLGMVIGAGFASRDFYASTENSAKSGVTSYSATQDLGTVSRSSTRQAIRNGAGGANSGTSYVNVQINGKNKVVLGNGFTDVKSVLEAGDITLQPGDQIAPSLTTRINEKTIIRIDRANAQVKTDESPIPFNTIEEKTDSLPAGTTKVKTEGQNGVMETTSLVTEAGSKHLASNIFASFVKTVPVDKVILVGTGGGTPAQSGSTTTTTPVGEAQSIAHDVVASRGWGEDQFTCLVQLWNKESGWRTNAANPSGAYGIPQALPGSKMASAGPNWQTDAHTQIVWGLDYIQGRYGTPCGAWAHSQSSNWY
ncbi:MULTISPECIES: G5 domain-containing protein [unclassified Bifidobacterium]|nr:MULTISPECIES: G5 domain-containing protein [unclassified Bifidobacterium]